MIWFVITGFTVVIVLLALILGAALDTRDALYDIFEELKDRDER